MKKLILLTILSLLFANSYAQENKDVTKRLKEKYDFVCYHGTNGGWYSVENEDGNEGVCDLNGNEIIPPIWDEVHSAKTYYEVKKNGKVGIRDKRNKELLPCKKYTKVWWYQKEEYAGFCEVEIDQKKGAIDAKNNEVVPCLYDDVSVSQLAESSFCDVKKGDKKGVWDIKQSKEIIPCLYDAASAWQLDESSFCDVEKGGKKGVWDVKQSKEIIPCLYDEVYSFQLKEKPFCEVKKNGKDGIVNKNGKEVLACGAFDYIINNSPYVIVCKDIAYEYNKSNYTYTVHKNGKWGVYDLNKGALIVPCKYDYVGMEEDGVFSFNSGGKVVGGKFAIDKIDGGKWGFVDTAGKELVPAQYSSVTEFKDGVAQVTKDGVTSVLVHPLKGASVKIANGGGAIAVDENIPVMERNNENAFAFIIANENYIHFSGADFSINDGKIFAEYCKKTLGLPEKNVRFYEDATYGNMVGAIKKLQDIADVYEGDAKIILYYSGLGATDESTKEKYLLPTDASMAALGSTGYSVADLLKQVGSLNVENTWVVLDAPFSNTDKNGKTLASSRGVAIKSKPVTPQGSLIVSMACDDMQTAYSAKKYGHSLLTYGILEKIQKTKGNCTIKEVSDYAGEWVKKKSLEAFDKKQVPVTNTSESIVNKWNSIKL